MHKIRLPFMKEVNLRFIQAGYYGAGKSVFI